MPENPTPAFDEIRRNVAGIDIAGHADHYVCGPRREDGGHDIAHFGTATAELQKLLAWLKERKVGSVALESTSVYWNWIPAADVLESAGIEAVLVDTREVRMVPGRKSDVKDCQWLRRLHSCGLLRGGFRPPERVTAVRTLLREKDGLVAMRTQCVQRMQKSLDQMNVRVHHAVSDIDGKTGLAIVGAIVGGQRDPSALAKLRDARCKKSEVEIAGHLAGTWREEHLFNLGQAYRTLLFIDERIAEYDAKAAAMFRALADSSGNPPPPPPPAGEKTTQKGLRDAAEKRDLGRFPTERHFAAYIGLAPSLGKSAGKNVRQRKRCRNTSRAGRALRMAASTLHRSQTELGAFFRSVARRTDRKTAVKATARRMAHMIYRAVRYGAAHIDRGAEAYERRIRERTLRTVRHLIKSHKINELELTTAFAAV